MFLWQRHNFIPKQKTQKAHPTVVRFALLLRLFAACYMCWLFWSMFRPAVFVLGPRDICWVATRGTGEQSNRLSINKIIDQIARNEGTGTVRREARIVCVSVSKHCPGSPYAPNRSFFTEGHWTGS